MAPKQRMRIANEKATKNITLRGNVPKSSVSFLKRLNYVCLSVLAEDDAQQLVVICRINYLIFFRFYCCF